MKSKTDIGTEVYQHRICLVIILKPAYLQDLIENRTFFFLNLVD